MCANIVATIGVIFGIVGSGILFYYSRPQPDFSGGGSLDLSDNNIAEDGRTFGEWREEGERLYYRYKLMSKVGFLLIGANFLLQGVSIWL